MLLSIWRFNATARPHRCSADLIRAGVGLSRPAAATLVVQCLHFIVFRPTHPEFSECCDGTDGTKPTRRLLGC